MNDLALFAGGVKAYLETTTCSDSATPRQLNAKPTRHRFWRCPPFPTWAAVCSVDGCPWRDLVNLVLGGFPCQDIPAACPALVGKGRSLLLLACSVGSQQLRLIPDPLPAFGKQRADLGL